MFQQLKERRIVQIVASTAVSGWVAMEVVSALVERGFLPELVYAVGLVIFLGGLAASAIIGWYHGEKGHQRATPTELALLFATGAVTLFFAVDTVTDARDARTGVAGRYPLDRVAVLYFDDRSRDAELAYLAEGLTESLVDRLSGVTGLDVISLGGVAPYRDGSTPLDSIAAALGAGTLVRGWVEPRGDQVRVNVALYEGDGGTEINRDVIDHPADQVFSLQDDLAEDVADRLRGWIGEEVGLRRAQRETENGEAWTAFRRGQRARATAEEAIRRGDVEGFIAEFQRADSLYLSAQDLDPSWAEPIVSRAILASRWGELSAPEDPGEGRAYLDLARARADSALARSAGDARAHFVRGTVQYQIWLLGLSDGAGERDRLFGGARTDLERAVALDPGLAAAHSTLSILYSQIPDPVSAALAAQRALEADEFLRSADAAYRRIYQTSYDLGQFREAEPYCTRGRARFPTQPDFVQCRLWLMGAPRGMEPDPDAAWRLRDEHLALVEESDRAFEAAKDELLVAMVLARAGMPDSARAVVARVRPGPGVDPARELLGVEALVHLALDDPDQAIDRLRVYLTASPEHRAGWQWSEHWWWRPLQNHPEYRRIMGL